jgi:multiple sugar transport system ATP-binding protein
MRVEIKKLHQKVGNTVIYVTHDQVEAMTLADRIVLMRDGHIVQTGTPLDLFNAPVDTFVATFIGSPPMNLVDGLVTETGALLLGDHITLPMPSEARGAVRPGQEISFGFRADNLMPDGHSVEESGQMAPLELEVALTEPLGTETLLFAEFAGREVQAKMLNPRPVQPGERLPFHLMLDKCHVFDRKSGKALRG